MSRGTLYVFFHGLTVIRQGSQEIELVLPAVPDHLVRAGNWLTETDIARKSVLRLEGVNAGTARILPGSPIIDLTTHRLTQRKRAGTLWLPFPREILLLLRAKDLGGGNIFTTGAGIGKPEIATIQVFVYDFDNENRVALDGHRWEPCSVGGAISLHVICTDSGPVGAHHVRATEAVLHEVIDGYPGLSFSKNALTPPWIAAEDQHLGPAHRRSRLLDDTVVTVDTNGHERFAFALAELEDIGPRSVRLARLGRIKQSGRPIQSLWREPDPLGELPDDCQQILVRS